VYGKAPIVTPRSKLHNPYSLPGILAVVVHPIMHANEAAIILPLASDRAARIQISGADRFASLLSPAT